jgi:ferritin-like metal-binding protein YciE
MTNHVEAIVTLQNLLDYDMRKLAVSEMQLKNILPEWINTAQSEKLKIVLKKYLDFTETHLNKISTVIASEKILSAVLASHIVKALIEEAEILFNKCSDAEVRDAAMLAAIQQINHYKICAYGTAAAYANILGKEKEAIVFHEAEVNEKQIDDRLSQLAEYEINSKAKSPIVLL